MTFSFLNKNEKSIWLPLLFQMFYENMREIAPTGLPCEEEKREWLGNVAPALDKEPRQIILCLDGDILAGYIQYYTRENLLMIEEVQIRKAYQRTTLFYGLCKYLIKALPESLEVVEAYAEKRNVRSQKLMQKLGMSQVDEEGPFVHYRGPADALHPYFK
jgi:hypothetical protein